MSIPPPPPPVTVSKVLITPNKKHRVTRITVGYSGAMSPAKLGRSRPTT